MTVMAEEALGIDVDLDEVPGCQCGRLPDSPCTQQAVANVHIQHACAYCLGNLGAHGWVLMCDYHLAAARDGSLKCGICKTPGGYRLLAEVPL